MPSYRLLREIHLAIGSCYGKHTFLWCYILFSCFLIWSYSFKKSISTYSVCVCVYIYIYTHIYIHVYTHVAICVCMWNIYIYTHTHTHTHIYIHTHTYLKKMPVYLFSGRANRVKFSFNYNVHPPGIGLLQPLCE